MIYMIPSTKNHLFFQLNDMKEKILHVGRFDGKLFQDSILPYFAYFFFNQMKKQYAKSKVISESKTQFDMKSQRELNNT